MSTIYDDAVGGVLSQKGDTGSNIYDDAVMATLRPQSESQRARAGYVGAVDTNPDQYAEEKRLAQSTGMPISTVSALPNEAKKQAKIGEINFSTLAETSPATAKLLADYDAAKLAHDDLDILSKIEKGSKSIDAGLQYIFKLPNGKNNTLSGDIMAGVHGAAIGAGGFMRAIDEFAPDNLFLRLLPDGARKAATVKEANSWGIGSSFVAESTERAAKASLADMKYYSPPQKGNFAAGVSSGVQSTVQNVFTLPLMFTPGGQGAALGMMSTLQAGRSFQDARMKGISPGAALPFAISQGAIEYGTERLPVSYLFKDLAKSAPIRSMVKRQLAAEIPGEQIATIFQDMNDWAVLNPEKPFSDYLKERPDAAVQTLVATLVGSAGTVGIMKSIDSVVVDADTRMRRAEAAQQQADLLQNLADLSKISKLRERSPETFQQFVANASEGGPVNRVYIDANTLMQSGVGEQIAAASPSVAEQLPQALQTGGQIAIPVGEYAAKIAPLEQEQTLRDHLKIDPDGFSTAEANTYMQEHGDALKAEVEKVIAQQDNADTFRQSADAVRETVKSQLDTANRFTSPVNDSYASLVGNFYVVQAGRLGTTPEDLYAQYPLKVTAESVGGYDQALETALPHGMVKGGGDDIAALYRGETREDGARAIFLGPTRGNLLTDIPALEDFSHSVDTYALNHAKGRHSDAKIELSRGQVAITDKDVAAIPDIITTYDAIRRDLVNKRGDPIVAYAKVVDDGILIYMEEVRNGRKDMAGLSLWKMRPTATSAPDVLQHTVSESNVRNDGRHKGIVAKNTDDFYKKLNEQKKTYRQDFEEGPFGPILRGFKGDAQGAIAALTAMQNGEAVAALHHPDIGDIDLVWGEEGTGQSDGYGLAKLARWHPEVLDDLQGILSSMRVISRSKNRINLESADHKAAVRLTWDGQAKNWLLTAFERKEKGGGTTRTDTGPLAGKDDTASLTTASDTIVQQRIDEFHQKKSGTQRGGFTPDTLTISLLKDADLSTFLHESGHFFLEAQFDMAAQIAARQEGLTEGEKSLVADSQKVLDWFGVKDLSAWNAMSFEEKRKHHEQFARGFESYVFEGQSPNTEMTGLFQRFRAWLLNIYKSARNLNVPMTDDIRGVFDRMLATEEQIALAERGRAMMPLFESAEHAGMTEEEFTAYHALGMDATSDAIQDLQQRGLRDMQWLHNARGRVIKSLQKKHADMREGMRQRVADEVNNQPIYRAERFIRYGDPTAVNATAEEGTKKLEGTKLSLPALKEMYSDGPEALWRRLPTGKYGTVANEGMDPDLVAGMFGYTSGDELVQKLLEAVPRKDFIEAMTDARMFEEHGELSTPDAIERMADSAIHNEVRSRFITTEYNAMAQAVGGQRILTKAAKEYAAAMIARQKVKDVRPRQYANAEARASKAADKAFKAGDITTAAAEKRNQLIQNLATKAAYETQDEIEKGLTYLHKMVKPRKTIDPDYTDQIHKLLERFDLKPKSKNTHTPLTNWLEAQQEDGYAPDVPESLKNESVTMPYWTMSVEEFRGLVDTVKQIEHIGRQKKRLLTAIKDRDYETVRDEIVASIRDHSQGREQRLREPANNLERASDMAKRFGAEHIRIATAARIMDGGKDGGSLWEYFIRTANKAGDTETRMRAEATEALMTIMKPLYDGGRMEGRATYFKSIGRSLNRGQIITMALNRGNEGNLQRLLDGENWTIEQITPILETLTAEELLAVQGIWNHFESYRPLIAAKERRVYGKEPDWVEPVPFTIKSADGQTVSLKGGYFPIKYDLKASERSGQQADAEEAKRQLQGAYTSATTRRSFTKARSEEVKGRPLSLDISGMFSSVNEIIHDLSWHEWLIDNNRLLRSHSISTAIREHYGNHTMEQFKSWSKAIAEGDRGAVEGFEWAMSLLTRGTSISGLGYNLSVAAFQPLGLSVSIPRIGARYVGLGLRKFLASPIGLGQEIMGKSDFMRYRTQTRFRELNEIQNKVRGKNKISEAIESNAYYLMVHAQLAADLPTWQGGYEKAIAEGNDESRAIALADQAVIDSQGSGMIKDMSAIERSKLLKIFTVFYSFMGSMLNTGVMMVSTATTPLGKLVASGGFMTLVAFNAIGPELLKSLLTPGDSGDWDDPKKVAKKLAGTTLDGTLGMVVFAREISPAAKAFLGLENYGYKGPTGLKALNDLVGFGQQVNQGEPDDSLRKASINVAGDLLRLPSAQTNRTVTGVKALVEGKTHNPMAIGFGFEKRK